MIDVSLLRLLVLGIFISGYCVVAEENGTPKFKVISSRTFLQPPSIEVTFPNGIQDELILEHYKLFKENAGGYNYIGHLKHSPESSVAVTGILTGPDDVMEVTLISEHTLDKTFQVDFYGETTVIPNPPEDKRMHNLDALSRDDVKDGNERLTQSGDAIGVGMVDQSEVVYSTNPVKIPPKMKLVLKFGYTESMAQQLKNDGMTDGNPQFPEFIEKIMVHAQAHYNHYPSLGTQIQLEVQEGFLYNGSKTWCAEDDLWRAKDATDKAQLINVGATSWWVGSVTCESGNGGVVGRAYLGHLCDYKAVNMIEKYSNSYSRLGTTFAHELGHNLQMKHDMHTENGGYEGHCYGRGIMSYSGFEGIGFSPCSRTYFEHGYAYNEWGLGCLEDVSRPCTEFTCENGGTCSKTKDGGFICKCPPSVTGTRCENTAYRTCKGETDCCSSDTKCREMDGDCDDDSDCEEGLICGKYNCPRKYGYSWDRDDSCCFKPNTKPENTCQAEKKSGYGKTGTCVFPFYYEGIKYNNCIQSSSGSAWCSFKSIYDGTNWGYCTEKCPDGKCQAKTLDCPVTGVPDSWAPEPGLEGECVFPFTYNKRVYSECANLPDNSGAGWCAFDHTLKDDRWGYCTSSCLTTKKDPCVCNVPGETCNDDGACRCGTSCSCEHNLSGSFCDPDANQCKCSASEDTCVEGLLCDITEGKCGRCIGQYGCCTKENPCDVGEGDCHNDEDCQHGLKCGDDNCRKCGIGTHQDCGFWTYDDDCCFKPDPNTCYAERQNGNGKRGICVFPFNYNGIEYNKCIPSGYGEGLAWCSFDKEFNGNFGYCQDEFCSKFI